MIKPSLEQRGLFDFKVSKGNRGALHRQDGTASSLARGKRLMRSSSLF
jgi:hypothetical protein